MSDYWDGHIMVCTDCLFTHHHGAHEHDGQWYSGDSDTPSDREPLNRCDGLDLADSTDSETGEGIDDFSWSPCDGCGSHLGGSRYRLAYHILDRSNNA